MPDPSIPLWMKIRRPLRAQAHRLISSDERAGTGQPASPSPPAPEIRSLAGALTFPHPGAPLRSPHSRFAAEVRDHEALP